MEGKGADGNTAEGIWVKHNGNVYLLPFVVLAENVKTDPEHRFLTDGEIEKMLDRREAEDRRRRENRIVRASYNDALQHAQGRLLFWLYQAIVKGQHNGELEQAFENFQEAERKIKDHDRHIVAEQEGD